MPVDYILFAAIVAFAIGFFLNLKRVDERALTDEQLFFANVREPRFYVQRDATQAAAASAIAEFEHCRKMLVECGNKHIELSDVHLFIYRANESKPYGASFPATDFEAFEVQAKAAEMKKREEFTNRKANNMKNNPADFAKWVWGQNEN